MKKKVAVLLVAAMTLGLTACGSSANQAEKQAEDAAVQTEAAEESAEENSELHKIGVMVYNRTDEEVLDRKKYLEGYIEDCFDVDFIYSEAINGVEDAEAFIQNAADAGVEGIISFTTNDIEKEVALCAENEIYYMMGSETIHEDEFNAVCDNPWFLGVVGPGEEAEYNAGVEMAQYFLDQDYGKDYFILLGGAPIGNEMHRQRAMGILDTFAANAGVEFPEETEAISAAGEVTHLEIGDYTLCLVPGYVQMPDVAEMAAAEYEKDQYDCVISVYNGSVLADTLKGAHVGIVDCFSEQNMGYFNEGQLDYITGKYGSIVGPSFAAMYNAITGHADMLRDNGKAFQMTQGFWTSADKEDYEKKYIVASSMEIQAYNYEDLRNVCVEFNENATLDDLKALTAAYTYEDVCARRGIE
ncbi:MAG: hypothetical protein MJ116_02945 [Lachnospiraceae bacterium]|nr:hypothetical protein [Lachnospiraceae bacterium]